MNTFRKIPDFPRCSTKRKKWAHWYRFLYLSANQGDTSVFLSLVCIIMASQRALLVVYLVSLVYVRSAKCLGREEAMSGWGGCGGEGTPVCPALPYIHGWLGFKLCPEHTLHPLPPTPPHPWPPTPSCLPAPPKGDSNLGRIIFYLIEYLKLKNIQ